MTTPSRPRFWFWPAILAGFLSLTGCLDQPQDPLRIGLNPWPGYDFLYLAAEKGWIAEAGGDVTIVGLTSLGDSRRAFERGQVDAFGGTPVELMLAREHSNRRPRAFYVTNWSAGADQLLAPSTVDTMEDLRGKRVGVEPASLDLLVLATALDQAGMALDAVERVGKPQTELPGALEADRIDAAVSYPPVSRTLKDRFGLKPVFDTAEAPRAVLDFLIADARALRERPADFAAVVQAFHRAVQFAAANPSEAHRIIGRREGLSPGEVADALDQIRVLDLADQDELWTSEGPVARALGRTAAILHEAKHLPQETEPGGLTDASVVRRTEAPR